MFGVFLLGTCREKNRHKKLNINNIKLLLCDTSAVIVFVYIIFFYVDFSDTMPKVRRKSKLLLKTMLVVITLIYILLLDI